MIALPEKYSIQWPGNGQQQISLQIDSQLAQMINGNSYEALTIDGIPNLFSEKFQGQQFILQILSYLPNQDGKYIIQLSDGYCYLKGVLVEEAKSYAIKYKEIRNFMVIKFLEEDIVVMDDKGEYSFQLKRCIPLNSRVSGPIGEPISYSAFLKNGSKNEIGSNRVSDVSLLSIKEVKQMFPGKITGTIKAKVIRKPDKVKTVLNIMIRDEQNQQIQCCLFGYEVGKYVNLLQQGGWYKFQDLTLQTNNKFSGMVELKVTKDSNIIRQEKQVIIPGIIPQKPKQADTPVPRPQKIQFDVGDQLGNQQISYNDCFYIGKVLRLSKLPNEMGRYLLTIDRNNNKIEVVLWNDIETPVSVGGTYEFNHMKVKFYRNAISLNSQRRKTYVQIASKAITYKVEDIKVEEKYGMTAQNFKPRNLSSSDEILTISQMLQRSGKCKLKVSYYIVVGHMIIKINMFQSLTVEQRTKYFYMKCNQCEDNQYRSGKIMPECLKGKIICSLCRSNNFNIMWNIKVSLMDAENQVACKLNSEITQKLTGLTPEEGMIIFLGQPDSFRQMIGRINYTRGVFKFITKLNDKKDGEKYFNICEYYENSYQYHLKRSVQELKNAEEAYEKYKDYKKEAGEEVKQEKEVAYREYKYDDDYAQ